MAKTGIYFYKSSIDKCLREIDKAKANYEKKIATLLEKLGELGQQTAWGKYHETQLNPSEEDRHSINVTYEFVDTNTIQILGNGKGICFLEFGAGAATDESHPFADNVSFQVKRGSYSDSHNGMYAQTGYDHWYFGGVKYSETKQRAGMYEAYKAITQQVYDIAKEVLG